MIHGIQQMAYSLALTKTPIFRVPCIMHVMQLSLKDLLGAIKIDPKNTEAESEWSDSRTKSLQSSLGQSSKNIKATLKKVSASLYTDYQIVTYFSKIRDLAVFINASPQHRNSFRAIQLKEPKLLPIQDVCTCWNSTFLMLNRARKLQRAINKYYEAY